MPVYRLADWLISVGVEFPDGTWITTFGKPADPGTVAAYLTLSFNLLGEWDYFNNAYWSLPVEFQLYLLFPLFLLLVRWHPLALVAGALGLFALNGGWRCPASASSSPGSSPAASGAGGCSSDAVRTCPASFGP